MRYRFGSGAKRGLRGESGATVVEFAIVIPVLLLLVIGGMDLGHRYLMQYLTSNASREGARYAAKYTGNLVPPNSTAVSDYVKLPTGLNYNKFHLTNLAVSASYTGVSPNEIVTVTVQAEKQWWILSGVLGLPNPTTVTATTAMNVES
jgi:hypothetical protein